MIPLKLKDQRGVTAILFGFMILMLLSFGALAVDLVNLYVAKNQLQNAADAGSLAGARELYIKDGSAVNYNGYSYEEDGQTIVIASANEVAYNTATANKSQETPVDVEADLTENTGDIQRGHWSFATRFSPNNSTVAIRIGDYSKDELDAMPNFINAVKVVARRNATPVASFFARIFGYENFQLKAEAVAYIGFPGTLYKVDQPIAICKDSIEVDGNYSCNIGRMQNATNDTARWTNFTQPCETATPPTVNPLICASGNPDPIIFNQGMGTINGVLEPSLSALKTCWETKAKYDSNGDGEPDQLLDTDGDGIPDQLWNLTLPVIDCSGSNTCSTALGAVNINVVWITEKKDYNDVPMKMGDWVSSESDGETRWNSFVDYFKLKDADGDEPAPYEKKSIYFLPTCEYIEPTGVTGGDNYGVLAKIPVLVNGED
ncbi:MAG: hypothetical protein ISS63_10330 [Desulfobacteraceae bacterium]|nr:hypothetical protein [Desulfobacteraceae bacterium]